MSEDTVFKPNEKELKLFEQEKIQLYKGTFVVCITYGLSAFFLLIAILFTKWGKEYIYDKFAPAVITYILGSIIIIIYLLSSIYTIKPRRVGEEVDTNIECPEYWKLEKVPNKIKEEIIKNNNIDIEKQIIPEINREASTNIQYRCISDVNVYGNNRENLKMKNYLSNTKYESGFNSSNIAQTYTNAGKRSNVIPDYIVNIPNKNSEYFNELKKYAKFSGAYSANNSNIFENTNSNVLKVGDISYINPYNGSDIGAILNNYETNAPLICNVVYPQVLGILDSKTREGNGISCEYAKQCGISWSSLNCNK
jgi:hypothetical protein